MIALRGRGLAWVLAGVALIACYAPAFAGMAEQWSTDEDMGHAFAVPPVIAWVVWKERERRRGWEQPGSPWGLALLALGAGFHAAGAIGAGLFAESVGLLVSSAGIVVALGGFVLLRTLAFPFLLALFMLPKLAIVYNQFTLPLQLLASRIAAAGLTAVGIGVLREGNILQVQGVSVAVEEACNGIRYLLPLGFAALVYGYISGTAT
jgi:exosortase